MSLTKKSFSIPSKHNQRQITGDITFELSGQSKPIVLYIHGFKGFKDWGHFNLMAEHFGNAGFVFVKINLSHNGTTPENLSDTMDLEAFGRNNFSIEQDDINSVLDYFESEDFPVSHSEINLEKVYLVGHSRGGGAAIIKTAEDSRIKKLVTWASVSDLTFFISEEILPQWKEDGVFYIMNARTNQKMPLYYQIVEDFQSNKARFTVLEQAANIKVPHLVIHGDQDETIDLQSAHDIHKCSPNSELFVVKDGLHSFGGTHPYDHQELPVHAKIVILKTINFFED